MRRYKVARRGTAVDFIHRAIEKGGGKILSPADPRSAPFEVRIRTPAGETLDLVCYAFTANKYRQAGRPSDEHRFQLKYGSDTKGYHKLHVPETTSQVTLMFGVHLEEKLFIACDPEMHRWTRFFRSVEFKSSDLALAKQKGWHGWERERSIARRRLVMPRESFQTEILLGFRPEHFLRYVAFERIATGEDPGERLLLADKMGSEPVPKKGGAHPLETELGLSANQILDLIGGAFRLHAAVRGSAAEHHLGEHLRSLSAFKKVEPLDKDGQPDFSVETNSGESVLVECKNVLRKTTKGAVPVVDFQKTRVSKGDACTRYYRHDQFQILAACLHPVSENWDFRFCRLGDLAPHKKCKGRIAPRVLVEGSGWTPSILDLI